MPHSSQQEPRYCVLLQTSSAKEREDGDAFSAVGGLGSRHRIPLLPLPELLSLSTITENEWVAEKH